MSEMASLLFALPSFWLSGAHLLGCVARSRGWDGQADVALGGDGATRGRPASSSAERVAIAHEGAGSSDVPWRVAANHGGDARECAGVLVAPALSLLVDMAVLSFRRHLNPEPHEVLQVRCRPRQPGGLGFA